MAKRATGVAQSEHRCDNLIRARELIPNWQRSAGGSSFTFNIACVDRAPTHRQDGLSRVRRCFDEVLTSNPVVGALD